MPAFFFDTDQYIYGTVMANYTSGAPVSGNLTLKATFRPTDPYAPGRVYNVPPVYFNFVSSNHRNLSFDELPHPNVFA